MLRRIKWSMLLVLASILIFSLPVMAAPTVILDERQLSFEVPPIVENGRTLVPLRAIFEAMGASVSWDEQTNCATAVKGNKTIQLTIGSAYALINGQMKSLDVPAKVVNGRTLAPLRFVGEAFGGTVSWDPETDTITMISTADDKLIGLTKSNPIPRGKTYLTKQGLEISVNQMMQDGGAWSVLEETDHSNPPPFVEQKYVIVSLTIKNVSSPKDPIYISYADFKMIGSSNIVFTSSDKSIRLASSGSLSTLRQTLYHGNEEMGATVYYVPKNETNMLLIWEPVPGERLYFGLN